MNLNLTERSLAALASCNYKPVRDEDIHYSTRTALSRRGLIEFGSGVWTITSKGRAALRQHVPRLLHKNSQHGYTHDPLMALPDEPEAVDRPTLERFVREAHERDAGREELSWDQRLALVRERALAAGIRLTRLEWRLRDASSGSRSRVIRRMEQELRRRAA